VIGVDTLGQDRKLTEDEQRYAERLAISYRDNWERAENDALKRDVNAYVHRKEEDENLRETKANTWTEEETEA
jgi:hypothetical protein